MPRASEELTRYDLTCQRLRAELAGRLADDVDLAATVTASAYLVCLHVSQHGADWEEMLRKYTTVALRQAADECQAGRQEVALLRRELRPVRGMVLDVGAGWGRLAPLYEELGLAAAYVEPAALGPLLMRRGGLGWVAQGVGEALPFADGVFGATVLGWLLHHDTGPEVDAEVLVREAARVTAPGGPVLSVEPLGESFGRERWLGLLEGAGLRVGRVEEFYRRERESGGSELFALAVAVR